MMTFLIFNIKKKWRRLPLVILLMILTIFIVTQTVAIFHYPVKSNVDIHKLENIGETDYLYIEKPNNELKKQLKYNIEKAIRDKTFEKESLNNLKYFLKEIDYYDLNELIDKNKENHIVYAYLMNTIKEIQSEYRTPEAINKVLLESTNNRGYQVEFQNNYITYIQAIISFLLIAFIMIIFEEDDRYNIRESIKVTSNNYLKFYVTQLGTVILPIVCFTLTLGISLNVYSYLQFYLAGYDIEYLPIIVKYCLYFLPVLICFSSVLILIISTVKNYMTMIPLYLMWIIFNITPRATNLPEIFEYFIVLQRLDSGGVNGKYVIIKQLLTTVIGIALLILAYFKRKDKI